jgi:hypothetical protein
MAKRASEKRYKNVDRQMVHDDLVKASEILGITKSEFLTMCYLERNFDVAMLKEQRHPTEYLLRQISKIIKRSGVKRHWQDYIIEGPVQMEMDTDALKSAPVEPQEMSLPDRLSLAIGLPQQIEHELKGNQGIAKA